MTNKKVKIDLSNMIDDPSILMTTNTESVPLLDSATIKTASSIVSIDAGNLLAFDPRPIEMTQLKKNPDSYLKDLCQLSTQLLINQIFNLPVERVEDVIVAKLPKGSTVFPREKPLPKAKPPTKWEQYAKLKGIQKKKKSRMVFDETTKEWKPSWGYKKTKDKDTTNDWVIEIKKNEDPNQDFFSKRTQEKNERVAKNELKRLRNIARSSKKKVPGVGLTPNLTDDKYQDKNKVRRVV
jgi:regulator of ribosome biosynthesis